MRSAFGWEALVLAIPVFALVAFGFLALGWEKRAEREELRARCRTLVGPLREKLREGIAQRNVLADLAVAKAPAILPLPGEESDLQNRFEAGDFSGVLGEASSLSEAGLPLRTLAALRLLREETDPARLEELSLIIAAEPSLVTPRLLEDAEQRHRDLGLELPPVLRGWEERLQLQESVRGLLERDGELLPANQRTSWTAHEGRLWYALREGAEVLLVEKDQLEYVIEPLVSSAEASLPAGLDIEFLIRGPGREGHPVLYEAAGIPPIRFVISDASKLRAASSGRRVMFTSFLVLAGVLSAVGIVLLLRTVGRERELSERKGNLVAAVSHEMRTPVASIRLLAENLCTGAVSGATDREKHLARLVEQSERLSTLVENVLSYSKRAAGKAHRQDEDLDVAALLEESLSPFRVLAENQQVDLRSVVGEFEVAPRGDREALREAMVNLVDNALKFSPNGSEVVCGAELHATNSNQWRVWVEDRGPGVKKEERTKVFEAFYRVGSELRRETSGTGLGLALVQQVARLHHGDVRCVEAKPCGARFEIHLPLNPNNPITRS